MRSMFRPPQCAANSSRWTATSRPVVLGLAIAALWLGAPLSARAADERAPAASATAPKPRPLHVWSDQSEWIMSLAFLKDGRQLCVGTYEQVLLCDVRDPRQVKSLPLAPGYVRSLALSPDGKLLAAGHYQAATLIDAASWSIKRTIGEHAGYVTGTSFSPDGRLLATACEDGTASVWNVADGKLVRVLRGHSYPVLAVAFSPDGTRIATAAGDDTRVTQPGEVKVWNTADGKELHSFQSHHQAATGVAFAPGARGNLLASTGFDQRVIFYDLAQGKATSFFAGHSRPTNAVLFARNGSTVISAAGGRAKDGNEVKIWDRESGTELATLEGHTAKVEAIALSPDESLLASGSDDKKVILWDVKPLWRHIDHPEQTATAKADAEHGPVGRAVAFLKGAAGPAGDAAAPIRVGIIGLDTSHCEAFTKSLNDPQAAPDVAGFRVVAAYPRGSADIESSTSRIPTITKKFREMGVEIVDSVDALLKKVDVVLLETNDGRPHLQQALAVLKSGKRLFIDKPIAGSLPDAIAIFEASKHYHVPLFSCSSLRFGAASQAARHGKIGKIESCETQSPCILEKTHPDLYWYGIHGVEALFTVMGPGCKSVRRTVSTPTEDVVVGTWEGGRSGKFHGRRGPKAGYGGLAKGSKGTLKVGLYDGYRPLVVEIAKFFKTGVPPVSEEETLEIYAFMTAADESKHQNGAEVTLESVLAKARAEAAKKLELTSKHGSN